MAENGGAEVGALRVSLGLDSANFTQSMQDITRKIKGLNSEFKATAGGNKEFENSLEGMRAKSQQLSGTLQLQQQRVQNLRQEYERSVREKGKDAKETENLLIRYNNAVGAMKRTETSLKDVNGRIDDALNKWKQLGQSVSEAGDKMTAAGESMKNIGANMTASVTAPLTAVGLGAIKVASDVEASQGRMQAQLGLTAKEAAGLSNTARKLWKEGFGSDVATAEQAVARVKQNLKGLNGEELEQASKSALILADTFEYDVNESTRAAKALMDNFSVSGTKAFDYITVAAQKGGDYSQELLDTISEYSVQFSEAGLSIDGMFNILLQGAQNGAWNLDKVGDAVKEFNIRAKDGSESTAEGFELIGLNAEEMAQKIAKGGEEGEKAFMATVSAIAAIEDPVKRNTAGVALFGTQWEDLEDKVVSSLNPTKDMLGEVEGATAKAGQALKDNFGDRAQKLWRETLEALVPVGEVLVGLGEKVLPKVSSALETATNWFAKLSPEGQALTVGLGAAAAAAGPLIAGLGFVAGGIGSLMTVLGPVVTSLGGMAGISSMLGGALTALTGPVGVTVAALTGMGIAAYQVSEEMKKPAIESEIFSEKVSEATQKAVGSYLKLDEEATLALNQLAWSQQEVTGAMAESLVTKYNEMGERIVTSMNEKHAKQMESTQKYFNDSSALTEAEEAKILANMETNNKSQVTKVQEGQRRIKEILNTAAAEKRSITEKEQQEINIIQDNMRVNAVKTLSASETEQKVILERLKTDSSKITAEQAAQVVKNSVKQKKETVKEANEQYNKTVAEIIKMRDETGVISEEQAKKLIDEAKRQRDGTVKNAEDMHKNVVQEAKEQAGEHVNEVEWETGEVKSKWEVMKEDVSKKAKQMKNNVVKDAKDLYKDFTKWVSDTVDKGLGKWEDFKDGLGDIWDDVKADMKSLKDDMLKYADGIINGPIRGLNFVLGKDALNLGVQIPLWKYAQGTEGHPGGLAMVNDGVGPHYKELIQTPDGKVGMFEGRNVVTDLPKGTKVLSGDRTNKLMTAQGIPRYAGGIGMDDIWALISDPKSLLEKAMGTLDLPDIGGAPLKIGAAVGKKAFSSAVDYLQDKISSIFIGDGWTGELEKDPKKVGPGGGKGGMMRYVEYWYNQVKSRFGKTWFMGGYNDRNVVGGSSKSMHAYGRAFDIGGSHSTMQAIAEYLRKAASNLQYVIYNRKIAGPGVGKPWRYYDGLNPHTDHVHADFLPVSSAGGKGAGKFTGSAEQWRDDIIRAAMQMGERVTPAQINGILAQIQRESSGNPRIVQSPQVNDINMRNGNPARGLLQYIPSTFRNYAVKGYNDIYNGFHQLLAFFNNTNWRRDLPYGKRGWGPTGSRKYAGGTDFHPGGPAVVNDATGSNFKELIQLPNGRVGMFDDRNVMVNLPRGSKVLSGDKTKQLMQLAGIPRYAEGIGDLIYNVKRGDTLTGIARAFKTTVDELVKLNKIQNKNLIHVGQQIIYGQKKAQEKAATTSYPTSIPEKRVPVYNPRPTGEPAGDVEYLVYKYSKDVNNEIYRLEQAHNARMVALEKEREDQIKAIKDKAVKEKRNLTQKEKEAVWKLRDDYAAREKQAEIEHTKELQSLEQKRRQVRMQEINEYVQRKKDAGEMSLLDEIKVQRESIRYLEAYTDEWYAEQRRLNQLKVQLHNELMALEDEYLAKVKDVNQRVIDEEKRLNQEYQQTLESRTNSIMNFAGLFDNVARPEEVDPQSLIDNLHSQVWSLNNWRTNLDVLARRGLDQGLIEELQAMGPQALAQIKALNNMTESQLDQFEGLWRQKSEAARKQATNELAGMKEDTLKQIEQLHRDAEKELEELGVTFRKQAEELRTGVVDEFQPFGAQLKDIGMNAMRGLMDGMSEMTGPLVAKINEISRLMVDTMKDTLEIKSPSRKAKREIARNFGLGLTTGLDEMKSPLVAKMAEVSRLFSKAVPVPDVPTAAFNFGAGMVGSTNAHYDYSSSPVITLNYYGSGSEEDAMRMVDVVDNELAWRHKNSNIYRGRMG